MTTNDIKLHYVKPSKTNAARQTGLKCPVLSKVHVDCEGMESGFAKRDTSGAVFFEPATSLFRSLQALELAQASHFSVIFSAKWLLQPVSSRFMPNALSPLSVL